MYFLAVTRQLSWKGQKKGPVMPRGARAKTGFSPPLPPRIAPLADDRVLSASQSTKPRIRVRIMTPNGSRMVESGLPTPAVMKAVRLDDPPVTVPSPADSGYDIEVDVESGDSDAPAAATAEAVRAAEAPTAEYAAAPVPVIPSEPPLEFDNPNIIDPGAALAALVTGLRLHEEGDREGASRSVRRASKLDPDEPEYGARLARLETPDVAAVDARLDQLRDEHPEHVVVALEWSRHQRERENMQNALDGYLSVLARDIAHAEAARCVFELRELLDDAAPTST